MPRLLTELRLTLRTLARARLFTAIAVLSLGLALALNTTLFALVDGLLHPPVPYPAPDDVYRIEWRGDRAARLAVPAAVRMEALRDGAPSVAGTAIIGGRLAPIVAGRYEEDLYVAMVSPEFFTMLGVAALHGRTLGPADMDAPSAVIGYGLWRRGYALRPLADGLVVDVGGVPHPVVGVLPPGMRVAGSVLVPLPAKARAEAEGRVLVRVRPGVEETTLERELALVARRVTATHGDTTRPLGAIAYPLHQPDAATLGAMELVFLATGAVVLLIACANLATLLLARGAARRREIGVRVAIGATRWIIARQVLLECALLVTGGAAVGLLLTAWALDLVEHWAAPSVAILGDFVPVLSWRTFAFVLVAILVVVIAAGLLPARRAAATPPAEPIREGGGTTRRRRGDRWSALLIGEVALSTALLMAAALFVQSSWRMATHDFAMDAQRLVRADVSFDRKWERDTAGDGRVAAHRRRVYEGALGALRAVPGVREAAIVRRQGTLGAQVTAESGRSGERWMNLAAVQVVSPTYLRTVGIPVLSGRDFAPGDAAMRDGVVIVDDSTARRLWPDVPDPTGRMLKLAGPQQVAPWLRVIGVARSLPQRPDRMIPADPAIYVIVPRDSAIDHEIVVAGTTDADLPVLVRRALMASVPGVTSVQSERWLADFDGSAAFQGFVAMLYAALGAFALVLCAVGLYGVLAYTVCLRARELAIRLALGARRGHIARDVLHDAAVVSLAGVGIGAFIALVATRAFVNGLYPVPFAEARALVIAEAILLAVAAVAAWGPVRRATRADPAVVLQAG